MNVQSVNRDRFSHLQLRTELIGFLLVTAGIALGGGSGCVGERVGIGPGAVKLRISTGSEQRKHTRHNRCVDAALDVIALVAAKGAGQAAGKITVDIGPARDQADRTGKGVTAIKCRLWALDDFDPFDVEHALINEIATLQIEAVEVGRDILHRRRDPQIGLAAYDRLRQRAGEGFKRKADGLVRDIAQIVQSLPFNILAGQHRDRQRHILQPFVDPAGGDDDGIALFLHRLCHGWAGGLRLQTGSDDQCQCADRVTNRCPAVHANPLNRWFQRRTISPSHA